jgi:hypothetical protein
MLDFKIVKDECDSPRETFDNIGTMICAHRALSLGDAGGLDKLRNEVRSHKNYLTSMEYNSYFNNIEELLQVAKRIGVIALHLPLYLYKKTSMSMNTTGFQCRFDSSQVGYIYVSKHEACKEYGVKRLSVKVLDKLKERLLREVALYDFYLKDEVYGFEMTDKETGDDIDSCFGFFGPDIERNGMLGCFDKSLHPLALAAASNI